MVTTKTNQFKSDHRKNRHEILSLNLLPNKTKIDSVENKVRSIRFISIAILSDDQNSCQTHSIKHVSVLRSKYWERHQRRGSLMQRSTLTSTQIHVITRNLD
jgi:hypothetical protein